MSGGHTPRSFDVTNDDYLMMVANQDSHNICSFIRRGKTDFEWRAVETIDSPAFVKLIDPKDYKWGKDFI